MCSAISSTNWPPLEPSPFERRCSTGRTAKARISRPGSQASNRIRKPAPRQATKGHRRVRRTRRRPLHLLTRAPSLHFPTQAPSLQQIRRRKGAPARTRRLRTQTLNPIDDAAFSNDTDCFHGVLPDAQATSGSAERRNPFLHNSSRYKVRMIGELAIPQIDSKMVRTLILIRSCTNMPAGADRRMNGRTLHGERIMADSRISM